MVGVLQWAIIKMTVKLSTVLTVLVLVQQSFSIKVIESFFPKASGIGQAEVDVKLQVRKVSPARITLRYRNTVSYCRVFW